MTTAQAYRQAQIAGKAGAARIALSNEILGNARKRQALRAMILRTASAEYRALVERFFPHDTDGWSLLYDIAGKS